MHLLRQLLQIGATDLMALRLAADIDVERHDSDFALNDVKACADCLINHRNDRPTFVCNCETMKVHPLNPVAVYPLDRWMNTFPERYRRNLPNCDYIFADAENIYASRKIAFCDLTCSLSKYVEPGGSTKYPEGKRNHALRQMSSMAEWLMKNPMLHHHISTATDRRYIFGVRYTDPYPGVDPAATSMRTFGKTPASLASTLTTTQSLNGIPFSFVEIRYPAPLVW